MIIRARLSDEVSLDGAIRQAVEDSRPPGLADHEWERVKAVREEDQNDALRRWGTDICVEFDTEKNAARVVPATEAARW